MCTPPQPLDAAGSRMVFVPPRADMQTEIAVHLDSPSFPRPPQPPAPAPPAPAGAIVVPLPRQPPIGSRLPMGLCAPPLLAATTLSCSPRPQYCLRCVCWGGVPPSYADVHAYERALLQHNMTTVVLVGSGARFLRFPDHLWGHGLNKILQEMVVMAYLPQLADRAFVFEDYTWSHSPLPYTLYDFALCPAYIPLNSFVVGPLAGAPFPQYDSTTLAERSGHDRTAPPHARRAVSTAFYSAVCLPATVHTISSADAPRSHFSPSSPPPPPSPHDSPHPDFPLSGSKSVKFKSHAQQHDGSSWRCQCCGARISGSHVR
ncbi:hypothetical protein B0H10DRAFT_2228380 [Mycena sp. CBHHK59/15]|nr:hypothetical protein B0H10DRAFT_2228380 [Mycena sp. CBHHK59/15]